MSLAEPTGYDTITTKPIRGQPETAKLKRVSEPVCRQLVNATLRGIPEPVRRGSVNATPRGTPEPVYREPESTGLEGISELESKIHVSDCVDFMMRKMSPGVVALTVTSPPYDNLRDYRGYEFPFKDIAKGLLRVTKKGGVVVWVVGDKIIKGNRTMTSFRQGLYFQEIGFQVHDVMIYQKKNTPFMRSNAYTNCYEFMFVLSKGTPATFNPLKVRTVRHGLEMLTHNKLADGVNKKVMKELKKEKTKTNIWQYAVGLGGSTSDKIAFEHPAIFPEQLAKDQVLSWTDPGDLVFDPMCGSGTTCKMAMLTGRRWMGVDIAKEYVRVARQRIHEARAKNGTRLQR